MNPNQDNTIQWWWEDFHPGQRWDLGQTVMKREDLLRFAHEFDPQTFHTDEVAAADSPYGGLIASGWHTCALTMRLMCDAYLSRSSCVGSPGMESLKWLKPVRPGDTLRASLTVLQTRPMQSKPDLGLVQSLWDAKNQHGEMVLEMQGWVMFRRRVAAA